MVGYYAIENPYGITTINNGTRPNLLHRFASREERDEWVDEDEAHREAAASSDSRVRWARNAVKQYHLEWPVPFGDGEQKE